MKEAREHLALSLKAMHDLANVRAHALRLTRRHACLVDCCVLCALLSQLLCPSRATDLDGPIYMMPLCVDMYTVISASSPIVGVNYGTA
jgi:hypothetical protein